MAIFLSNKISMKNKLLKNLVNANYDILLNSIELGASNETMKNTLASQKESLNILLDGLEQKLDTQSSKSDMSIDWWNELSNEWKELIIFNSKIAPFTSLREIRYDSLQGYAKSFENATGEKYVDEEEINDLFFCKLLFLNSFIVTGSVKDLTPLKKFKHLIKLKIQSDIDYFDEQGTPIYTEPHESFNVLSSLKKLRKLLISYPIDKEDITNIVSLDLLEDLTLYSELTDALKSLKKLKKISFIPSDENVETVSYITSLEEIKCLFDSGGHLILKKLSSFKPLTRLKNLKEIVAHNIDENSKELKYIPEISSLKTISFCKNGFLSNGKENPKMDQLIKFLESNEINVNVLDSLQEAQRKMSRR